jgi:site-specific recombinase XerC
MTAELTIIRELHPVESYVASLQSERSRVEVSKRITRACALLGEPDPLALDWGSVTHDVVSALQALILAEGLSPAYGRSLVSAWRGCVRAAWRAGLIDGATWDRIADVRPIQGRSAPKGRSLSGSEIRDLLAAAKGSHPAIAARDRAMLAIMVVGALRRAEVAALDLADFQGRALIVRRGKGNVGRSVPIPSQVEAAITSWLQIRGDAVGPLLTRCRSSKYSGQGPLFARRQFWFSA